MKNYYSCLIPQGSCPPYIEKSFRWSVFDDEGLVALMKDQATAEKIRDLLNNSTKEIIENE